MSAIGVPSEFTADRESKWVEDQLDLYDSSTAKRVVAAWFASPTVAGVVAFAVFATAEWAGLIS